MNHQITYLHFIYLIEFIRHNTCSHQTCVCIDLTRHVCASISPDMCVHRSHQTCVCIDLTRHVCASISPDMCVHRSHQTCVCIDLTRHVCASISPDMCVHRSHQTCVCIAKIYIHTYTAISFILCCLHYITCELTANL